MSNLVLHEVGDGGFVEGPSGLAVRETAFAAPLVARPLSDLHFARAFGARSHVHCGQDVAYVTETVDEIANLLDARRL